MATIDPRRFIGGRNELESLVNYGFKALRIFKDIQGYPLYYAPLIEILNDMDELGIPLLITCGEYGCITLLSKLTVGKDYPVIILGCSCSLLSELIISARSNKQLYVETRLIDSPDAFEILVDKVGVERLIFGSGIPFEYFQSSYMMVESSSISENDKDLILGENILRIIKERV